jgi:lysophospholipase L1-like esterase
VLDRANMRREKKSTMRFQSTLLLAALLALAGCTGAAREGRWFSAWATSHNARVTEPPMSGRSVRQVLMPNLSGTALRVKIENTMGEAPVKFSAAWLGVAGDGPALQPGTNVQLTFAGQPHLTLAPGQGAYSDEVPFAVKAFDKLALSLDVESAGDISTHHLGLRLNWSAPGARAADPSGAGYEPLAEVPNLNTGQWPFYWVAALDVRSAAAQGTIAFLADSITDGRCSTRDDMGISQPNLYQRWVDVLALRLAANGRHLGVANAGIAGNRVLNRGNGPAALERLDRDILDRAGLTHIVFFEGTNDIGGDFSAAQVIAGAQQILARARARGVKVIGVTAIPRGGATVGSKWTAAKERERLALNDWIRGGAGFDGVIDFDTLMKGSLTTLEDGSSAAQIPKAWDCDGVHPNVAGYRAMGEFVDLKLFD